MANRGGRGGNFRGKSGGFRGGKGKFDIKKRYPPKPKNWQVEEAEIRELQERYSEIQSSNLKLFEDFPFSKKTQKGLQHGNYTTPTEIQRESIGLAIQGHDILGAAKTGSGKTLAFLIPILECLYRQRWTKLDGLGALVITPTRELAYQIFQVLTSVGKFHDFSAGLVIGGKQLKEEAERINFTNIVICTPGRLLQHMDETINFSADNLKMLVLDEADRILDLGFAEAMNAIIANLPQRQTLLFSATQTKSVKDLARLSLKEPMYVSVHEHSQHSTPSQLEQSYMVCEQHQKMDVIWSFIKNHLKSKILIFMSSCKQVRYIFETMRKLRPGVTVLSLHGAMQQMKRMNTYQQFCRKQHAVLFATDIAARGLDFPAVNWVVQLDCPEDANTYIHRAGRTARYEKDGESLLLLLPSEEKAMVQQLSDKKIPINHIKVNPKRLWSIQGKMESLCASDVQHKTFAQRAFMSYLKSVFLMSNKEVFDVHKMDTDQYARSLGLGVTPKIRFLKRDQKRREEKSQEALPDKLESLFAGGKSNKLTKDLTIKETEGSGDENSEENESDSEAEGSDSGEESEADMVRTGTGKEGLNFDLGDEDLDDILTVKRKVELSSSESEESETEKELEKKSSKKSQKKTTISKYKLAKQLMKKNIRANTKVVFGDDDDEETVTKKLEELVEKAKDDDYTGGLNISEAQHNMKEQDVLDKETYRQRIKQKHKEKRLKEKENRRKAQKKKDEGDSEQEAVLDTGDNEGIDILDTLPDPDKLYGSQGDDDDDNAESSESSDSDDERPPTKRTKREESSESESETSSGESEKTGNEDESGQFDTGYSLMDDEQIALQLLQS